MNFEEIEIKRDISQNLFGFFFKKNTVLINIASLAWTELQCNFILVYR